MAALRDSDSGPTHYEILSVTRDAPPEVIRAAWLAICRTHHPDRKPSDAAAAGRVSAANVAYEALSDPASRAIYDRSLLSTRSQFAAAVARAAIDSCDDDAPERPRIWLAGGLIGFIALVVIVAAVMFAHSSDRSESAWIRLPAKPDSSPESPAVSLRLATSISRRTSETSAPPLEDPNK